jgi:hypothetical protein
MCADCVHEAFSSPIHRPGADQDLQNGGKTLIDLDSVDDYHASLPHVESRAIP